MRLVAVMVLAVCAAGTSAFAADDAKRAELRDKIVAKFDADGDGKLNEAERAAAKAAAREHHDKVENVRDHRENIADRKENRRDRREDVRDAKHDGGARDKVEDVRDRREDVRDRAENRLDRRENRVDRQN